MKWSYIIYSQDNRLNTFSKNQQDTLRYDYLNGIPLAKDIHVEFHNHFGYGKNTIEQFISFLDLEKESIISQFAAGSIEGIGSETSNQLEVNINQVKERLIEINERLINTYIFDFE